MFVKLKDIANIQSGVNKKSNFNGNCYYLQIKHFSSDGELIQSSDLTPELLIEEMNINHVLQQGDILLAARGSRNFAYKYKGITSPAVAASVFLLIRITDEKILPDYLTWYLNSPQAQSQYKNISRGSNVKLLSKSMIAELEISIPSMKTQIQILKMQALLMQEKKLSIRLIAKREELYQSVFTSLINNEITI